ncbi:MAG TPA: hypothetical protein VJ698_22635 [Noviherbaspirillum sp.]|uniref:hypothetical protein n=1 Tax=Noviherbaspirillum sp. TaxID=1926288 RepID=UPI002B4A3DC1|nr:hypothetical protein [Noviherbaspirillum sp.]HJV88284.1 hypothetical protein [Noviherbaspirillum sp.]
MTQPTQALADYFDALARLKAGQPLRVMKGTKITNDAVALEAGRGKGSIKKSRQVFQPLIQAIAVAATEQSSNSVERKKQTQLDKIKGAAHQYRKDLEVTMASLVARLYEIHELKKKVRSLEEDVQALTERLSQVSSSKVRPIHRK